MSLDNYYDTYEYVIKSREFKIGNKSVQYHPLSEEEKNDIKFKILYYLKENKEIELQELLKNDFTDYSKYPSNNKREVLDDLIQKGYIFLKYCYCPICRIDNIEQSVLLLLPETPKITQLGLDYLRTQ